MASVAAPITDKLPMPRDYQTRLLEIAKQGNTIVCLPTGSGKTYIAVKLILHYQHELLDDFSDENAKRTIFLVPTKPLVNQQADYIKESTDLEVGCYTGQSMINNKPIDFWNQNEWNEQFQKYKVLVMVHQLFLNLISLHKYLELNRVNLIIFDEAHHAGPNRQLKKVNHAYVQIAEAIKRYDKRPLPRILALSASIIKNNVKCMNISRVVGMLEDSLNATCATITGIENLEGHGTDPKEILWKYDYGSFLLNVDLSHILDYVIEFIRKFLNKNENGATKSGNSVVDNNESDDSMDDGFLIGDIFGSSLPISLQDLYRSLLWLKTSFNEMGPWCLQSSLGYYIDYFRKTCEIHKDTFPAFVKFLEVFIELYLKCNNLLEHLMENLSEQEKLFDFVSPKMRRLLELLSNYQPHLKKLCGLIFVDRRNECTEISRWLNAVARYDEQKYGFLKVGYAVGVSSMPGFVSSFVKQNVKKQEEVLNQFREKENPGKNLLIATSVLEEGIDVPQCNLVVRYNPPKTFRDYVQSKGRARAKDAHYILFSDVNKPKLEQSIRYFHDVNVELQKLCKQRGLFQETDNIIDNDQDHENDVISKTGARVTLNMSINLVYMYCAKLPSDSFTMLRPVEELQCDKTSYTSCFYRYIVLMPINSGIPKVIGCWSKSKLKAKKLAYREVCRQLYINGKLTDNFGPVKRECFVKTYYEELGLPIGYGDETVEIDDKNRKMNPGTRRKKQAYRKEIHESLQASGVPEDNNLFLYSIEMSSESTNSETKLKIGFLSFTRLPIDETRVSSFPVFNRNGIIKISFKILHESLALNSEKINLVKTFNEFIFKQALKKTKDETTEDSNNFNSGILLVLLKDWNIDWNELKSTVCKFEKYNSFEISFEDENKVRKGFKFVPKDYVDAVVVPWYRDDERTVFYKVRSNDYRLNPDSPFPKEEYGTYRNYFFEKYKTRILLEDQLLLAVDGYDRSFARISPIKKRTKLARPIHLVPELCRIWPIKSTIFDLFLPLPAIFYRLNQLFVAEQFRRYVEIEVFADCLPQQTSSQRFNNKCDRLGKSDEVYDEIDVNEMEKSIALDDEFNDSDDGEGWWLAGEDVEEPMDTNENWDEDITEEDYVKLVDSNEAVEEPQIVSMNNVNANPKIIVKGVDERNLDFNPERLEPLGSVPSNRSLKVVNENFDWKEFVLEITEKINHTYENIANEFVSPSHLAAGDEPDTKCDEMKVAPKILDMEVMKRVKSFDDQQELRQGPNANLILQALTSRRCMDVFNFERLEMIGDSFLKLSTALFMFCKYPEFDVKVLVLLKDKQVSNFNLFRLGKRLGIPEKMMFHAYDPTFRLSSIFGAEKMQMIDDKSVADCVEALIGAYLLRLGPIGAIMFMKWLGLNVTNIDSLSIDHKHWINCHVSALSQFAEEDGEKNAKAKVEELYKRGRMHKFEEILEYKFNDRTHLVKAFTHSSYYHNTVTGSYQRYEFLGDAILDYLITRHIFEDDQEFNPGELTDLRQSLVHNGFFGCLAVKYKFHKYLKHLSPDIFGAINRFATKFSENESEHIYGSFLLVTEDDTEENEEIEIPKILGDVFESVAAAIYIDSGFSLDTVWNVYYKFMESALINNSNKVPKSPSRQLFESDSETKIEKAEVNIETNVVSVKIITHGQVFEGFGSNKKFALQSAAKKALKALKRQNKLKTKSKPNPLDISMC